ncbi:uncharacterized protein BO66DRAFT_388731 [Aspergillus aculeatinus CBS 121060]|uniref:Uncharacterized protein n=1 Tax=Aspergillus aculeatinus CBS 121060 TaxID=1448322 RepID=A0ACD1HJ37_9EURO|nr:hypothetical protein BO66DRAFT_388731 [Aspergillus aculeatinus CBS 121060]RAH73634.1 hypothetical protein BO66DRAFT_388731 [Aspergillus aculeatinus CBS 121060]
MEARYPYSTSESVENNSWASDRTASSNNKRKVGLGRPSGTSSLHLFSTIYTQGVARRCCSKCRKKLPGPITSPGAISRAWTAGMIELVSQMTVFLPPPFDPPFLPKSDFRCHSHRDETSGEAWSHFFRPSLQLLALVGHRCSLPLRLNTPEIRVVTYTDSSGPRIQFLRQFFSEKSDEERETWKDMAKRTTQMKAWQSRRWRLMPLTVSIDPSRSLY